MLNENYEFYNSQFPYPDTFISTSSDRIQKLKITKFVIFTAHFTK